MSTAVELESWLRGQAKDRLQKAAARRVYARAGQDLSDEDRKVAHTLAEQMMGRKIPKTSRAEERKTAQIEERIASKLDQEAATLVRFADWVADQQMAQSAINPVTAGREGEDIGRCVPSSINDLSNK